MIQKFAPFLGQYRKYAYLTPVFVLLDVLAELSMPLLMSRIIDVGIVGRDSSYILRIGGYMVLLALGGIGFGIVFMRLSTVASMGFGANLRDALFSKIQQFSFTNIDRFSTASLVTRLTNDVNNLQMTFMMALRMLFRAPLMLLIAFVLAFNINAGLSVVLAVAIPVLVGAIALILRAAFRRFAVMQQKIDAINGVIQENLIGQRVVKAFVRADYENGRFKVANDALTQAAIRAVTLVILNLPVMFLVMNGATLAIIWWGGRMVYLGALGAGELVSFLSYVMQILMSVMMISMVFIMTARAQASGQRVLEVLEAPVDIVDPAEQPAAARPPTVTAGRIEFRGVSFRYNQAGTGEDVLAQISFTAEPGEVIGLVGGTGAGKSTLVNLIPRLYDVSGGAVLVDGVDVRDYALTDLRDAIGCVPQTSTLFSGSIRSNLLWGRPDATDAELERACRAAQAHDFILALPQGYETQLGQGGVNLSGGQKQRLCIARALLKQPRILILDDSTSAVDATTEARLRAAFAADLVATTIFIIAQRLSSVRHADKIIVLDDGRISGVDSHAALLQTNAVYQEINQSQGEGVLAQ